MSANSQASIGQVLRDTRAALGITLDDAAARLRLMHRQVEAMETDDFDSLGQPVFARGFVRNYARLLGIEPETLLARMEGAPVELAVSRAEPPLQRSWLASAWLILLLLGLLVIVGVPVALYLWLNSDVDEAPQSRTPPAVLSHPAPAAAPAPVALPVPVTEPAEAAPPAVQTAPVAPAAPAAGTAGAAEAGAPASPAPAPAAPASPASPAAPAVSSVLHIEFGDEAWTEIKDVSGRMLHRKLNPAGSHVDINGRPPFDVVIGNASQARVTYNGRPIDLKPFIDVTVARFTLEE